jgi:small subunit ribosomal protein S5
MATTTAMRASGALAASGSVSSLRVKPFTALVRPAARVAVRPRAAAVEGDLDFSFSFSDAKKANEYTASDVEAALRFYESGEGSSPAFDADFVTNAFGVEDASFFDDIDNEDAYGDEYIAAGIPEAAPKQRGRGRQQVCAGGWDVVQLPPHSPYKPSIAAALLPRSGSCPANCMHHTAGYMLAALGQH